MYFFSSESIFRNGTFTTPSLKGLEREKVVICAFDKLDTTVFNIDKSTSCVIGDIKAAQFVPKKLGLMISKKPDGNFN